MPSGTATPNENLNNQNSTSTYLASQAAEKIFWAGEVAYTPYAYALGGLQYVDDRLNYVGEQIYNYSPEIIQDFIMAAKPYFPNKQEVFLATVPTILAEMVGETWLNLGNDILSKEVFRDFAKIFGIFASMVSGTKYGGTDYEYDMANVWAQVLKTSCKALTIGGTFVYGGPATASTIAPLANIVCEIPSRAMILLGREQQEEGKTDVPFFEYAADKINYEILASAVTSTMAKKGFSTLTGLLAKPLNIHGNSIKAATDLSENLLSRVGIQAGLNPFGPNKHIDSAYQTLEKTFLAAPYASPVTVPLVAHIEAAARTLGGMTYSYIAIPGSRFGQDVTSHLTQSTWKKYHGPEHEAKGELLRAVGEYVGLLKHHATTSSKVIMDSQILLEDIKDLDLSSLTHEELMKLHAKLTETISVIADEDKLLQTAVSSEESDNSVVSGTADEKNKIEKVVKVGSDEMAEAVAAMLYKGTSPSTDTSLGQKIVAVDASGNVYGSDEEGEQFIAGQAEQPPAEEVAA